MIVADEVKAEIKKYALQNVNEEVCGIICENEVIPLQNLSKDPRYHFVINPLILIEKNVDCIYHSHVISTCKPSRTDIMFQKQLAIPFLIYGVNDDEFYFLNN